MAIKHVGARRAMLSGGLGLLLAVGGSHASQAVDDTVFPTEAEVEQIVGLQVSSQYELPAKNVMATAKGWRKTKCYPSYTRNAAQVRAVEYLARNPKQRAASRITVYVWEYPSYELGRGGLEDYVRKMFKCPTYRLYLKGVRKDPGFPMRTKVGKEGVPSVLRHKFGDVVDSSQTQVLRAADNYVIEVDITNSALSTARKRPPFPSPSGARDLAMFVQDRIIPRS